MKTLSISAVLRSGVIALCLVALSTPQRSFAESPTGTTCTSDAKLLNGGTTKVFGVLPGTYWNLIEGGLQTAFGNDEAAKIQYLSGVFDQQFTTLAQARDYNLQSLSDAFDANQNGLLCVYDLRGTRTSLGDPYSKYTYFMIADDKASKKASDALRFRTTAGD